MATDLERLVLSLEANVKKYERALAGATGTADRTMRQIERRVEQSESKIDAAMGRVGGAVRGGIAGILAGASLSSLNALSDSYTKVQNSLKVTGLEGENLKGTYRDLFELAQKQGIPLESLADLYSKTATSQKELNASSAEVVTFTTAVATALRAGGVGAAQADQALMQLGQALASGKVQWEEMASVVDSAPTIMQAAAAGIQQAEESVGKLTALIKDGKVSSEALFRGIIAGLPAVQALADKTQETSSQGVARLKNAMIDLVGALGESTGASRTAASALNSVADSVMSVTAKIPGAIEALSEYFEKLKQAPYFQSLVRSIAASEGGDTPREALVPGAGKARSGPRADPDQTGVDKLRQAMKSAAKPGAPKADDGKGSIFDQVWDLDAKARGGGVKPISLDQYKVPGEKKSSGGGGGGGGGKSENEYQRETASIRERTAALENEAKTVGRSEGEIAKSEAAFKLLEAAKKANVALTPQLLADIETTAAAIGTATQKLHEAEDAYRAFEAQSAQLGHTLSDAFKDAILNGQKLSDVIGKLLKSIAARGIDSIFDGLFGKGGAGTGLLSSVLGIGRALAGDVSGIGGTDDGGEWLADGGRYGDGPDYVSGRGSPRVRGPGGPRDDEVNAHLSDGEFVVNARETARNLALLHRINDGRMPRGGSPGEVSRRSRLAGGGSFGALRAQARRSLEALRRGERVPAVGGIGVPLAPMSPPAVRSAGRAAPAMTVTSAPTYNITPAAGVTPDQLRVVLEAHDRALPARLRDIQRRLG
ncbi:MAG: tape measure protein [Methylorubrum rhodinum]|uniref:tape measure protein n=1 Tax=Methylorubrum rhodinum TaxID=29428 RepID=UPI003BB070F9